MKKTKKGFTLLEVILGLVILGFALVVGAQTFAAVGGGYTRATMLDNGIDYIFNAFEQGTDESSLPSEVKKVKEPTDVSIRIGDKVYVKTVGKIVMQYAYNKGGVFAQLYGLDSTYGTGK